jgi:hypothetical protein
MKAAGYPYLIVCPATFIIQFSHFFFVQSLCFSSNIARIWTQNKLVDEKTAGSIKIRELRRQLNFGSKCDLLPNFRIGPTADLS